MVLKKKQVTLPLTKGKIIVFRCDALGLNYSYRPKGQVKFFHRFCRILNPEKNCPEFEANFEARTWRCFPGFWISHPLGKKRKRYGSQRKTSKTSYICIHPSKLNISSWCYDVEVVWWSLRFVWGSLPFVLQALRIIDGPEEPQGKRNNVMGVPLTKTDIRRKDNQEQLMIKNYCNKFSIIFSLFNLVSMGLLKTKHQCCCRSEVHTRYPGLGFQVQVQFHLVETFTDFHRLLLRFWIWGILEYACCGRRHTGLGLGCTRSYFDRVWILDFETRQATKSLIVL